MRIEGIPNGTEDERGSSCGGKWRDRGTRLFGERDGEGDGGYAHGVGRMYLREESRWLLKGDGMGTSSRSLASRSRRLPLAMATSRRHWATSGRVDSLRDNLRLEARSATVSLSNVAELRSLRTAAFSRSAHSDRLTNSKASGTSSTPGKGSVGLRADRASGLKEASDSGGSSDAVVSLKRSKEAATFLPIARFGFDFSLASVRGDEADEADSSELETEGVRNKGLADFEDADFDEGKLLN